MMNINEKKIAFILCVNDEEQYSETALYLKHLQMPPEMSAEIIPIWGAASMCEGYEQGRQSSNAKYKVYLHQDVLIIKKNFIEEILKLFANPEIGMIGLAGCEKLHASGIWWEGDKCHSKVAHALRSEHIGVRPGMVPETFVEAVDGVLIATQYDVPWRKDIFHGWHFYDISISMEYQRRGYKLVLPRQTEPWVIHQTINKNLGEDYHYWRYVFLHEYQEVSKCK